MDRVEFAIFSWLTIAAFVLWFSFAAMVRVDWKVIKQAWRRWRDSR